MSKQKQNQLSPYNSKKTSINSKNNRQSFQKSINYDKNINTNINNLDKKLNLSYQHHSQSINTKSQQLTKQQQQNQPSLTQYQNQPSINQNLQQIESKQQQQFPFDYLLELEKLKSYRHDIKYQGKNAIQDKRQPVRLINRHPYNCYVRIKTFYQDIDKDKQQQPKSPKKKNPKVKEVENTYGIGGLIGPGIILTAAHVVAPIRGNRALKRVQCKFQYSDITFYSQQIMAHPYYDKHKQTKSSFQDMAIVILKPVRNFIFPQKFLQIKWNYDFEEYKQQPIKFITYIENSKQKCFYQSDHKPTGTDFHSILTYQNITIQGDSGSLILFKQKGQFKVIGMHLGCSGNVNCGLVFNNAVKSPKNIFNLILQEKAAQQQKVSQESTSTSQSLSGKKKQSKSIKDILIKYGNYTPSDDKQIQNLKQMLLQEQRNNQRLRQIIQSHKQKQRNQRPQQMKKLTALYSQQQNSENFTSIKTTRQQLKIKRTISANTSNYSETKSPRKIYKRQLDNFDIFQEDDFSGKQQSFCQIMNEYKIDQKQQQYDNQQLQVNCNERRKKTNIIKNNDNKVQNFFSHYVKFNRKKQNKSSPIKNYKNANQYSTIIVQNNQQIENNQDENQQKQNCLANLCLFFYRMFTKRNVMQNQPINKSNKEVQNPSMKQLPISKKAIQFQRLKNKI